jgi:Uma2 family endonuclease
MATAAAGLMTAEEFYDWVHRPENHDRLFELDQGEVVEMPAPGRRHGTICANVTGVLWTYTRAQGNGNVCSNDVGLVLERDPDTVRGPDVALFLGTDKYSELEIKYPERMPDLVVEVLSPSDRIGKMLRRIHLFLERGVSMVWLLDPDAQNVAVWLPRSTQIVFEGAEVLTGFDVLPNFRCQVSDFFAIPGEPPQEA